MQLYYTVYKYLILFKHTIVNIELKNNSSIKQYKQVTTVIMHDKAIHTGMSTCEIIYLSLQKIKLYVCKDIQHPKITNY